MSDLISRSALLNVMDERYKQKSLIVPDNLAEGFMQMEKLIKEQPPVEAVPVVHGEWTHTGYGGEWECSRCKSQIALSDDENSHPNFCSNCGADMRKKVRYGLSESEMQAL